MKRAGAALLLALASCGGPDEGDAAVPRALADRFPIDGIIDFSVLQDVQERTVPFEDVAGLPVKSTTVRWAFANDDRDLYLAVEWTDDTFNNGYSLSGLPTDFDGVQLLIDGDGNGLFWTGEDKRIVIAASIGSVYHDQHAVASGDDIDLVEDGVARLFRDGAASKYRAEFLFPMADDATGQDGPLTGSSRCNLILYDHLEIAMGTGNTAHLFPFPPDSSVWPAIPVADAPAIPRPSIPSELAGLIAFVSDHDEPKGEIYTFAPATGTVTRVTNNSFVEAGVSLSRDRSRIAFFGTPDSGDIYANEIYVVNVDGTGWTPLTSNSIFDGHPGWSPDDTMIVYTSYRESMGSTIVMTAAGAEIADLTPPGSDDNDPDWLPDGRIVFKTDRFSPSPQVNIAVMNADGSGLQRLTSTSGVSDHDPVGTSTHALFERIMAGTDYTTDVSTRFAPWNLVEARLDGTGERTIVADGWVNWLPVTDPTGAYVAYLRGVSYNEVRLINRAGTVDYGRLIPGITRMRYLDWK